MKAALFDVGHTTAHAVHVVAYHDNLDHRLELRDLVGRNLVIVVDHFLDFQVMWRKGHFLWRKGHFLSLSRLCLIIPYETGYVKKNRHS